MAVFPNNNVDCNMVSVPAQQLSRILSIFIICTHFCIKKELEKICDILVLSSVWQKMWSVTAHGLWLALPIIFIAKCEVSLLNSQEASTFMIRYCCVKKKISFVKKLKKIYGILVLSTVCQKNVNCHRSTLQVLSLKNKHSKYCRTLLIGHQTSLWKLHVSCQLYVSCIWMISVCRAHKIGRYT